MNKNYPKSFESFWDKLQAKGKNSKTKNGCKFNYKIENNSIYVDYGDNEYHRICNDDSKESLYCDMLDACLVQRVTEY